MASAAKFGEHIPDWQGLEHLVSGKKNDPKPKHCEFPDIFGWGGGLPREGVGAKKFGMSFEAQGKPNFLAGCPGIFGGISQGCPKSLRKTICVQLWPLLFCCLRCAFGDRPNTVSQHFRHRAR